MTANEGGIKEYEDDVVWFEAQRGQDFFDSKLGQFKSWTVNLTWPSQFPAKYIYYYISKQYSYALKV